MQKRVQSKVKNDTSAHYTTDLFMLEYDLVARDEPWVARAECGIDPMYQIVVRFHHLVADGFGRETYNWYDSIYLRRNRLNRSVEFIIEEDGYGDECVVDHTWDHIDDELWELLVEAGHTFDAKEAFEIMLEITADVLRIRELTADDEEAIKNLPLSFRPDLAKEKLRRQAESIATRKHLQSYPFSQVVREARRFDANERSTRGPVVYLPDRLTEKCTTDASQVAQSTGVWFTLVLNQAVANPTYLAGFFNTNLGTIIRESMEATHLPRVRPETFQETTLYLPKLAIQNRLVKAAGQIRTMGLELNDLNSRLWDNPHDVEKVLDELAAFDPTASFVGWVETLPFPLASILWSYHVMEDDAEKRYRRLLQFFEALAEYVATVMLSAYSQHAGGRWEKIREKTKETFARGHLSITRATFGTWTVLLETLAKETRDLLRESPASCLDMFKTRDLALVEALSAKELVNVVKETNKLRNDWQGHSGAVGAREANYRYERMQEYLDRVRDVFGVVWQNGLLLKPDTFSFDGRLYHYNVEKVAGTRTPFARTQIDLAEPLISGQLYLWNNGSSTALRLLPLVKILPSPKTEENACYYFSRLDSSGPHYLSYHFGADSALTLEDGSDVIQALAKLGLGGT